MDEATAQHEAGRCLNCGVCCECFQCVEACKAEAVDHTMTDRWLDITVGSVILAPGYDTFDPTNYTQYRYAKSQNVITAIEFERILSASGPYEGHLLRPSDKKEPKKIAWLQCIGSRDVHAGAHPYCSSVCCMYAIKEAIIAKEHSSNGLDCTIFYMDIRAYGKDFERYYNRAIEGEIRFIRSRIPTVEEVPGTDDLEVTYTDESGQVIDEQFDLVVLSVGMEIPEESNALAHRLGLKTVPDSFVESTSFGPVNTSTPGIFVAGCFQAPKDIPTSVTDAALLRHRQVPFWQTAVTPLPRNGTFRTRETYSERDPESGHLYAGVVSISQGWWMSLLLSNTHNPFPLLNMWQKTFFPVPRIHRKPLPRQ